MGIFDRFRSKPVEEAGAGVLPFVDIGRISTQFTTEPDPLTVEPTQPLIQTPIQKESGFLDILGQAVTNPFDAADFLVLKDDRLRSIIELFGKLVARAFVGIDVEQEGDEETP